MSCAKVRHATKAGALIAWKRTGKNAQMNAYFCPTCKGFHLGNSRSPLRKMDRINQLLNRVLSDEQT